MTTSKERPQQKGRPQQRIEFEALENYQYISREEVAAQLEKFGLGKSRQMVNALYVSKDKLTAVGVLEIDEEMCRDHLINDPIFQGVLGPEAMAQTWILWKMHTGELKDNETSRFVGLDEVNFRHSLYPGVIVNIALKKADEDKVYGQILLGRTVITEGELQAVVIEKEQAKRNAIRRKRIQANSVPLFPFQE